MSYAICSFFAILPYTISFGLIHYSIFERDFFLYPSFLEKLCFILGLEISAIILYIIGEYLAQNSIKKGNTGDSARKNLRTYKSDGSSSYDYWEESVSWSDVFQEYLFWSIFYILAVWILWWFVSSSF